MEVLGTDDQGYQDWVNGRGDRIAARRERLGTTNNETTEAHIPINPQKLVDDALTAHHGDPKETMARVERAGDFLSGLNELLAAS